MGPKNPSGKLHIQLNFKFKVTPALPAGHLCKAQLQLAEPLDTKPAKHSPHPPNPRACVVPLDTTMFIQMPAQNNQVLYLVGKKVTGRVFLDVGYHRHAFQGEAGTRLQVSAFSGSTFTSHGAGGLGQLAVVS